MLGACRVLSAVLHTGSLEKRPQLSQESEGAEGRRGRVGLESPSVQMPDWQTGQTPRHLKGNPALCPSRSKGLRGQAASPRPPSLPPHYRVSPAWWGLELRHRGTKGHGSLCLQHRSCLVLVALPRTQ